MSAWKKSQQLQFGRVKTDDEDGTQNFCREMFISRRQGRPEDHYRVLGILGAPKRVFDALKGFRWAFDGFWMFLMDSAGVLKGISVNFDAFRRCF